MAKKEAVSISTKEYIAPGGLRRTNYLVTLKSDTFALEVQPNEACVSVQLNEHEAQDLLRHLWCSMPSEQFDAVVDTLKRENGF